LKEQTRFRYIFKEALINKDESKVKVDCDVDISTHRSLDKVENNLGTAILINNDGYFVSLILLCMNKNIAVKVISTADPNYCSCLVCKVNGLPITYLQQILSYFIKENVLILGRKPSKAFLLL
jgi:hypothetical protein